MGCLMGSSRPITEKMRPRGCDSIADEQLERSAGDGGTCSIPSLTRRVAFPAAC
jgi:hypothetical protein